MPRADFNPLAAPGAHAREARRIAVPAIGDAPSYVYAPETVLAVRVALATARPLLVTGEPGVGKSTLAESVAAIGGWPLRREVVTSRTQARDLMWRHDPVKRLAHAQAQTLQPDRAYVRPAALWWAFAPLDAARFDPDAQAPPKKAPPLSVVLIDEIDKAEPDVPNDLLEALDRSRFVVDDLTPAHTVQGSRERVLVVLTSNRERELPAAFLRRCVTLHLPDPDAGWLQTVAAERFGRRGAKLHAPVAERVMALRQRLADAPGRKPGTAEYIDALEACIRLGLGPTSDDWALVESATLWKRPPAAT